MNGQCVSKLVRGYGRKLLGLVVIEGGAGRRNGDACERLIYSNAHGTGNRQPARIPDSNLKSIAACLGECSGSIFCGVVAVCRVCGVSGPAGLGGGRPGVY